MARSEAAPGARLGTAHGEIEQSVMRLAPFERASPLPASVRLVEYDSVPNLIAAGVLPANFAAGHPQPFPGERRDGFVPDPPGGRD